MSTANVTRRAVADLNDNAKAMHARLLEAEEIYLALRKQAWLWNRLGASLPNDAALSAMRRLPALQEWGAHVFGETEGIEPVLPREPFYWEYLTPLEAKKRTKEALEWFDAEVRIHKEKAAYEARIRKLRRQKPAIDLSRFPAEVREMVAEIVREVVAQELPAAIRALTGRN